MDLTAIRAELASRLGGVSGLRAYAEWPDKPEMPAALITADDPYIEPHESFGSSRLMFANLVVTVAVAAASGVDRAQQALDGYVAGQILDVLYGDDKTMGGLVDDFVVGSISGLKQVPIAGVTYVAHEISVQVLARHS